MMRLIDKFLNATTMYRLVFQYAAALAAIAFVGGLFGYSPVPPSALAISLIIVTTCCWLTNTLFARLLRIPVNSHSTWITALLLVLILQPADATNKAALLALVVASVAAIASKYLLAVGRKHVFNPVAFGAVAAYLVNQPATWWVGGNPLLLTCIVAGGLLVVRKVQRFEMIGAYIAANLAVALATSPPGMLSETLRFSLIYSPLLFAGFAMLTEPLTAPTLRGQRLVFGAIVGALSAPNIHIGGFYLTPEMAFLVGNFYAFAVGPRGRYRMILQRIERTAEGCYDFIFSPDKPLAFRPGQYLDWTLDVPNPDNRGNRRAFTIASSPGENEVRLGVKFYPRPSAFKLALTQMRPGDSIFAAQVAGNFTLPREPDEKVALIAGGIGVTPFRSMIQDLLDRQERRPMVLLYGNNRASEISYSDIFEDARRKIGLHTVYAVAEPEEDLVGVHRGFIDRDLIQREVPDYHERTFYISGPQAMVRHFKGVLRELGVARSRIRVDYFPGFA